MQRIEKKKKKKKKIIIHVVAILLYKMEVVVVFSFWGSLNHYFGGFMVCLGGNLLLLIYEKSASLVINTMVFKRTFGSQKLRARRVGERRGEAMGVGDFLDKPKESIPATVGVSKGLQIARSRMGSCAEAWLWFWGSRW